jgi:integrase
MSEQKSILENQKSVQETSKQRPKTDVRYWTRRLFKPWYTRDGQRFELDTYAIKIQLRGRRETFALGTPNKTAAAARAREIYLFLAANGWEAAREKFKPKSPEILKTGATVGQFLEELRAKAELKPKTFESYCVAFRRIISDAFKVEGGTERFDYRTGGRDRWIALVHAIPLAEVTPARIAEWKRGFLARAGSSPVKQRAARTSVNSFLRQAKSLFAPRLLKHLEGRLELPAGSPFEGVDFEKRQSMRYGSGFDVEKLIGRAQAELASEWPEQFKIFLLAAFAGLRRGEIDLLEWSSFRWESGLIRIEATKWFHPKSEDSLGDVELEPEVLELFRCFHARARGSFVIESRNEPRPGATFDHYRAQNHFEKLVAWLRKNGVRSKTPLHSLRKEFGSQICDREGIYAASRALRHANIAVTAAHYLDKKKRVVSGLGHLLKGSEPAPGGANHVAA